MKKILLILLIIFIVYMISIFKLPNFSGVVGKILGIEKFNEFVIKFGKTYNNVVTDLPSKKEVLDTYNKTVSGAVEIKDTIVDGLNTTKGYIDNIRLSLSGSEEKIDEIKNTIADIKDTYNDTKEVLNDTIGNINNIKNNFEIIGEELSNTGKLTSTGEITNTGKIN